MAAQSLDGPVVEEGVLAFTDVIGFTEFTAVQGDEEALALVARHEELVTKVLPPQARLVKSLGDGFLLWFADPCEALDALLSFQDELALDDDSDWPLWVRIGAHWGRPLRRGDDLVGHDVNVAARILDVAGPGEVLASEVLRAEVDTRLGGIDFHELGPVEMKGIPEPVSLYRVERAGA